MRNSLFIYLLLFSFCTNAQDIKRTAIWYFGQNAGINFNTTPPTPLTDGAMDTKEGCATICDTSGNLLFYTNGEKIWNKNHQIMENGNGLLGHWSSTQSSLIVPLPENDSLFYVFATDLTGSINNWLSYSVVNMNANGGLGKVTDAKNMLLQTPVCEKLTATHHENGKDIWIAAHGFMTDSFFVYQLTKNGIINCPVISEVGSRHGKINQFGNPVYTDGQGAMKFSPNGKTLAVTVYGDHKVEIFDFDKATGQIKKLKSILGSLLLAYTVEFSPNQQYLYIGADDEEKLYQYDLSVPTDSINGTRKLIHSHLSPAITSLQMAIDKKLYQGVIQGSFTSRINRPDSSGDSALFAYNGFNLGGKRSEYGLPNFVTSYFYQPEFDFEYQTSCSSNIISFQEKAASPVTSRLWKVLKGSVVIDSSQFAAPNFSFSDSGWFSVQWIVNGSDTVQKQIFVDAPILLANDTLICNQPDFALIIPESYRCLAWQDGSDTDYYAVSTAGSYSIKAYDSKGCWVKDSILVEFDSIKTPNIRQSNDTLFTDSSAAVYEWRFNNIVVGANAHFLKISQNGSYSLTVKNNNGCENSSSFNVTGLSANKLKTLPVEVYPNPSNGSFFVEFNDNNTTNTILIRNLLGQIVFNTTYMQTKRVEVALGKAGIYFIEISDNTGKAFATKLIVKQ